MKKVFLVLFLFFFIVPTEALAYYNNMPASVVVGQPDFATSSSGTTASKFNGPANLHVDSSGRLMLAELANNRVLVWNSVPTENGKAADLVIGQADFTSGSANRGGSVGANTLNNPYQAYSDGTRLFVPEFETHRVLVWNTFPTQNGQSADVVVGNSSMTVTENACDQSTIFRATGVAVYDGKLIVSDQAHRRVLIWNSIPTTNGEAADVVLGQENFTTCTNNGVSQTSMSDPRFMAVSGDGKLFVVDSGGRRILMWNSIPTENNAPADVVIGQPDFTTSSAGTTASKIGSNPRGVAISNSKLFVPDSGNNRVLIWNSIPTENGKAADLVLGQSDFTSGSAKSLSSSSVAAARAFAHDNKLYASEFGNNRVLVFEDVISTPKLNVRELTAIENNRKKISGSVHLGEINKYTLHNVRVSVNGGGENFVTHVDGGTVHGNDTIYEWFHEFSPWDNFTNSSEWNDSKGFTLKVTSSSQNADDNSLLYFSPFNLNSTSGGNISFSVPKDHVNTIRNELSHFEVWNKISSNFDWTKVDGDLPTSILNDDGVASVSMPTSGEVKVVAVSKHSSYRQESNTIQSEFSGSYINPNSSAFSSFWYPLQVNSISGVTRNILSSFTPSGIAANYYSSTYTPTFTGIAFDGSTVAMRVTNVSDSTKFKDYYTTATNSLWKLTPTIYPKSVVNLSVYDSSGRYNQILPIVINVSQ